jgi:hypothetical protein
VFSELFFNCEDWIFGLKKKQNGVLPSLIPAFSPKEKGKRTQRLGKTRGWVRAKRLRNQG